MAELSDATAITLERLSGKPPARIDDRLVVQMISLANRFSGVLAEHQEVPLPDVYLDRSGPGFCLHETLAPPNRRTQQLLRAIHRPGESAPGSMTGNDLVHTDFHPGNILVNGEGAITGIVDWVELSRGD